MNCVNYHIGNLTDTSAMKFNCVFFFYSFPFPTKPSSHYFSDRDQKSILFWHLKKKMWKHRWGKSRLFFFSDLQGYSGKIRGIIVDNTCKGFTVVQTNFWLFIHFTFSEENTITFITYQMKKAKCILVK